MAVDSVGWNGSTAPVAVEASVHLRLSSLSLGDSGRGGTHMYTRPKGGSGEPTPGSVFCKRLCGVCTSQGNHLSYCDLDYGHVGTLHLCSTHQEAGPSAAAAVAEAAAATDVGIQQISVPTLESV